MKEKINLRNKKIILLSALASILVIIGIVSFVFNKSKVDNYTYNLDLDRAEIEQMKKYPRVKENESIVEECPNVEFDAFFDRDLDGDGYTERIHGSCIQIGKQDTIYMELKVNLEGELRNAQIDINSDNFYFETVLPKSEDIAQNAISDNTKTIYLQNIEAGKQVSLTGNVKSGVYSSASRRTEAIGKDISKLSNNEYSENRNSITLSGTYVVKDLETGKDIETTFSKTVYLDLDWHGTTQTTLPAFFGENYDFNYKDQNKNLEGVVDQENGEVKLSFEILTREDNYELNLNKSEIEIEIPKLNGYYPINVETIDADIEKILNGEEIVGAKITKIATVDEKGEKVEKEAYTDTVAYTNNFYRYNKFKITVTYPLEAYDAIGGDTIQLIMPVKAYYEGYNNTGEFFQNPYKSNVAEDSIILTFSNPQGKDAIFHVRVGKYMNYPWYQYIVSNRNPVRIWNGIGEDIKNDTYEVRWEAYTGTEGENKKLTIKENKIENENKLSDELFVGNENLSMEEFVKNTKIYFSNPIVILGKDGWIKVYDDDDEDSEPVMTFTKDNWNNYNSSNPYKYDEPIKHIRIETSETKSNSSLYIYNIKEIDTNYVTDNFSKEDYLKYDRIRSRVCGYTDGKYVNEDIHWAYYQKTVSLAQISLSQDKISTTETQNLKIYIDTLVNEDNNQEKWKNGVFLLKLPKELTGVEIKDVYTDNKELKTPIDYEYYVEDEHTFIKIITENVEPTSYRIIVDCDVTPDSTSLTQTKPVELYAINEICENYPSGYNTEDIYDLNDNTNTEELVNYLTTPLSLISTNNLLTSEYISNYEKTLNQKTYSPKVAGVSTEDRTARINIVINNNYSGTNSEIAILGRTPFEGNKFVEENNKNDMKSEFTAIMSNSGIVVPDELKNENVVTVYYSENGEATREFNSSNNWQDAPMDFSKVKSYMIYFNKNYHLQKGEQYEFYYDVTIPQEVPLNAESYSHHEIAFCWDTPQGKHPTKVRPGKVGITPVEKFNLQLTKFQTGLEKRVLGAYYSVTEIKTNESGEEEKLNSKTARTKDDGTLIISDLNIDRVYEIKEIKSPDTYELNSDVIRIRTSINNETEELYVEKIMGTTKTDITINQQERNVYLEVEDNASAKLKIQKTDKDNSEKKIANVRYKITGNNFPENGNVITTNSEGIAEIQGLIIGQKYILQEIKSADGYYLEESPIEITISTSDYTNYDAELKGNIQSSNLEVIGDSPVITINLTNERIPIFKIVKKDKNTGERLGKVKYILKGKGFAENGSKLATNENGEIQLSSLYLKEEYILEETKALDGYYIKSGEIKFEILNNNGNYSLQIIKGDGKAETTETNGVPTLVLTLDNEKIPTFSLDITKIEKDKPDVLLAGAKFRLYRDEKQVGEYISDENGKILIEGLYQYEEGKDFNSTYTLTEAEAPNGYSVMKDIVFKVQQNENGILEFIEENANIETPRSYEVVDNTIKLVLEDSPSFKLIKVDGEKKEEVRLPGTKFVIYNIDTDQEVPAVDSKGNIAGTKEVIDGKEYYVLTTDSNGEFTVDLAEGFYKAIEVKANSDTFDITNQTYYFGIGKSKKSIELKLDSANSMLCTSPDMTINASDGGTIRYRNIYKGQELDIGNGKIIKNESEDECEGIIAKYDNLGNLDWYNVIKISEYNNEYKNQNATDIRNFVENSLGETIFQIFSTGKTIQLADNVTVINPHKFNGINLLVKYDNNGNVLDYTEGSFIDISDHYGNATSYLINNDIMFINLEGESLDIGNGYILKNDTTHKICDGHLNENGNGWWCHDDLTNCDNQIDAYYNSCYMIKYNQNKEIEWCKKIYTPNNDVELNVIKFGDKYEIKLYAYRITEINFGNRVLQVEDGNSNTILYDINQTEDKAIVLPYSIYIQEIYDNGDFIAERFFENQMTLPNGEIIYGESDISCVLMKFNSEGIMQWYKVFDDKLIEDIRNYNENYLFINRTSDSGYIISPLCRSSNDKVRTKLIKLDKDGNVEWEKAPIEYEKILAFENAIEVNDGYLVQIYAEGSAILENNFKINETGSYIAMYDKEGNIKWIVKGVLNSYEPMETSDKGFIVDGYTLEEKTIDFGNNINITTKENNCVFTVKYDKNGVAEYAFNGSMYEKIYDQEYTLIGRIDQDQAVNFGDGIVMNGPYFFIEYDKNNNTVINAINANLWDIYITKDNGKIYILESDKDIDFGNGNIIPATNGGSCSYLIKCNFNSELEWYKNYDELIFYSAIETSDGGIITVVDNYYKEPLNLGNGVYLESNPEHCTTALIKFNKNGIAEWAKELADTDIWNVKISEQENNIIQVEGEIRGTLSLGENKTIGTPNDDTNFLFRYNPQEVDTQVEVENAYQIGGDYDDFLYDVVATDDGGYITKGVQRTSENASLEYIITKYSSEGIELWKNIIPDNKSIRSFDKTSDNGCIALVENSNNTECFIIRFNNNGNLLYEKALDFRAEAIKEYSNGEYIVVGNSNNSEESKLIKYKENEEKNNCETIFENKIVDNYTNLYTLTKTDDGGIVIGGYTLGFNDINFGNGIIINKIDNAPSTRKWYGIIIKYSSDGIAQDAKITDKWIRNIEGTSDGGYIINQYLNLFSDTDIIKYNRNGVEEWSKSTIDTYISKIKETKDGGYIYTSSKAIKYNQWQYYKYVLNIIKVDRNGDVEWNKEINSDEEFAEAGIREIIETKNGSYVAVGSFSNEMLNLGNKVILENNSYSRDVQIKLSPTVGDTITKNQYYYDAMILTLDAEKMIPEKQELTVSNFYKRHNITTEVEIVNGEKGGTISGEELKPYEKVIHGEASAKPIEIKPDEYYELVNITVNGEEYPLSSLQYNEETGIYIMPKDGIFASVTEDIHIIATFCYTENKFTIKKVDSQTGENLKGAKFQIKPMEDATETDLLDTMEDANESGIRDTDMLTLSENTQESDSTIRDADIAEEMGDTYCFTKSGDGSYKSNNQGKDNTIATSRIEVDLSDFSGDYFLEVNANISSSRYDEGRVYVTRESELVQRWTGNAISSWTKYVRTISSEC